MNVRPVDAVFFFFSLMTIIKLFFQFDFRRRAPGRQIVTYTMRFVTRRLIKRMFINNIIILTLNTRLLLYSAASKPTSNIYVYIYKCVCVCGVRKRDTISKTFRY